jgi:hypothetical protein
MSILFTLIAGVSQSSLYWIPAMNKRSGTAIIVRESAL